MSEGARPARADDVAVLAPLVDQVRGEMRPNRGGELFLVREAGRGDTATELSEAVDDGDTVAIVGTYDDVPFGLAVATVEPLTDGRLLGVLRTFLVDPEARGVGVGEAMMNAMMSALTERGCVGIDSVALPGDRETKNFFESFGLKARLLTVHRALDAPA